MFSTCYEESVRHFIRGYKMNFFGRRKIYTTVDNITLNNVIDVLQNVLAEHFANMQEEEYLYWYRKGKQPILNKKKEVRPEINHKIVQNIASEIVAFKNGYFLTQPTFYISRKKNEALTEKVNLLNDCLYLSGKQEADNTLVDWFHTVGIGVLFVESVDTEELVKAYAIDPRQAFVVYSNRPGNPPVMGVNLAIVNDEPMLDVFTKDTIYRVSGVFADRKGRYVLNEMGSGLIVDTEPNYLGEIPIIEYTYDRSRMSSFEAVLPLLDAVNQIQSNREDGIDQFIQSLLIFYNCKLGDDENGNPVTAARIREAGAIFLKSIGQDRADVKEINEQLDQTQTQVLVNDLVKQICDISGMPFTSEASTNNGSNNGAMYMSNGWQSADTMARGTEDIFKESNKMFDRIFLKILNQKIDGFDLKASDIDIQFTRNELDNILTKTQGALNLKSLGLSPELVLAKSGVSNDPSGDVSKSKEYIDRAFGSNEVDDGQGSN